MPKYPDKTLMVDVCFTEYEVMSLSTDMMRHIVNDRFSEAKKKIEHELGLDDGTFELSQDIK